jgi:hypothetical protein
MDGATKATIVSVAQKPSQSSLIGVLMAIRCANCSQLNLPDSEGRIKPWCSSCGAGLADAGAQRQTRPGPPGAETASVPFRALREPAGPPTRRTARKADSPWIFLCIGLGCVGLAVAIVASTLGDAINGWSSRAWPKTQGTVVRSSVEEWQSNKGARSFQLAAIYRYEVAGKRYESDRIQFCKQLQAGDRARGEEALAKIAPSGRPCPVYYDPSDPSRSCLIPGASLFYLIFLPSMALFLFLIGGVCIRGSARQILSAGKLTVPARASAAG